MNRSNRGGGRYGGRQDAKQMSMNRFRAIDPDLSSAYDNIREEEDDQLHRNDFRGNRNNRGRGVYKPATFEQRSDRQLNRSAAGSSNKEVISKVRVMRASRYGMRWLLKSLVALIDDLKPIMPRINEEKDEFEFFLKDNDQAQAVKLCSRRVKHPDNSEKINFIVERTMAPWNKLNSELKAAICAEVDSRASVAARSVDLSNFKDSKRFSEKDLLVYMTSLNVSLCVMEQLEDKFSNLVSLSLKGNRLKQLDAPSMLAFFAKQLVVLDLSENQIESISELERLRGLRLTTIFLEGNPLVETFVQTTQYASAVHSIFPRVTNIDGNACEPSSVLDEEERSVEPTARPAFFGDDLLKTTVETFLIEYFKAYDGVDPSISRKSLIAAYDDSNSTFTLTIEHFMEEGGGRAKWPNDNFPQHIRLSHNIKQIEKWGKNRQARIFSGAMEIASQLCRMPATKHILDSFLWDTAYTSDTFVVFTVQGLFEEAPFATGNAIPKLNFFSRTFAVTPREGGTVSVVEDQLHLSAMLPDKIERYRLQQKKALSGQPILLNSEPDDTTKAAMVGQFCIDSGMNAEWSTKCLLECSWDYAAAGSAFTGNKDSIPPEAFIKV